MRFEDTHCRSCGNEFKQTTPKWMIVIAILVALVIGVIAGMPKSNNRSTEQTDQIKEIEQQTQSRMALHGYLKDPSSAEIRNHKGNCGEVNSKNSFGGYVGFRRFIASSAIVAVEGENMNADEFQKAWETVCQ